MLVDFGKSPRHQGDTQTRDRNGNMLSRHLKTQPYIARTVSALLPHPASVFVTLPDQTAKSLTASHRLPYGFLI